jgi:membrane protein DedA with SNARE-associated domain
MIGSVLNTAEAWIAAYGVLALFLVIYFEAFGAPLPAESALISASVLAARGDIPIGSVVLAAWTATVVGAGTGYLIGRLAGRPLLARFGLHMGLTPERFQRLDRQVEQHGFKLILVARFVLVLRPLAGLLAGALSMPLRPFAAANIIGGALWVAAWGAGPYLLSIWGWSLL